MHWQQVSNYYIGSDMKKMNISREIFFEQSDTIRHLAYPIRDSLSYLLFLVFPALIYGCSSLETPVIKDSPEPAIDTSEGLSSKTRITINEDIESLDVFSFEDDLLQRLDSYQRFEKVQMTESTYDIATRSGDKIMLMMANSTQSRYTWADINCMKSMEKVRFSLENEQQDTPVMTGVHHIKAGGQVRSMLTPLTGEVVIRSIECDFSGQSYSGEQMTDVKVYLTNVNASCGIWIDNETYPTRIINAGRLNENDMKGFYDPEIICRELDRPLGTERIYPNIRLRAYPNNGKEESIGSPFTKLVIEGRICGRTWYYPIAVNRNVKEDYGLSRNRQYIYDISIRRTGLTDPDGTIELTSAEIHMEVKAWKEKDWYDIGF